MGIDPGKDGFAVLLDADAGRIVESSPAPVVDREYDLPAMIALARRWAALRVVLAMIEQQQAFPKQGGSSNFSTGYGYGLWRMALTAAGVPVEIVHPSRWKREVGIGKSGGDPKERKRLSIAKAQALFPREDLRASERCRTPHDGKAEAALLAVVASRRHRGER